MTQNRTPSSGTRQKIIAIVLVLIVVVIAWQVFGLFGRKSSDTNIAMSPTMNKNTMQGMAMPMSAMPQPAPLPKPQTQQLSVREMELMQLQQDTQAKYIAAVNELQMLKINRDIAETNQAIATAKFATVAVEKKTVDLLSPPQVATASTYAKGLVNPAQHQQTPTTAVGAPVAVNVASYTVISVSELQYKWGAVLGYQGNLYNVQVGDILPPDGSKVVHIDRQGVILSLDGVSRKISLVPII